MPQSIAEIEHAAAIVAIERLPALIQIGHVDHAVLETIFVVLRDVAALRVLDRAEVDREGHLLIVADALIAKHEHRVAIHAGVDGGNVGGRRRLAQVDAGDFSGEFVSEGFDGDWHKLIYLLNTTPNAKAQRYAEEYNAYY